MNQFSGIGGGTAQSYPSSVPVDKQPTVYSLCVESVATLERILSMVDSLGTRIVGPTPTEAAANNGPMPLQAVANQLRGMSEVIEKRLGTALELLGG